MTQTQITPKVRKHCPLVSDVPIHAAFIPSTVTAQLLSVKSESVGYIPFVLQVPPVVQVCDFNLAYIRTFRFGADAP